VDFQRSPVVVPAEISMAVQFAWLLPVFTVNSATTKQRAPLGSQCPQRWKSFWMCYRKFMALELNVTHSVIFSLVEEFTSDLCHMGHRCDL